MNTENTNRKLTNTIRTMAGTIGASVHDELDTSDAENYDFQVQTGLARATVDILDYDPHRLLHWLGYGLIDCGINLDSGVRFLIEALHRQAASQMDAFIDAGSDERSADRLTGATPSSLKNEKNELEGNRKSPRLGPSEVIKALIKQGYFSTPRIPREVREHWLSTTGDRRKPHEICVAINRAFKAGMLRRINTRQNGFDYGEA